ncbi:MAG TPA: DUF1203 domain-containing protein [Steroidobacteraceae bacterium]|nr:DUF1203 domain-containing protein [Steroidobacteraceae bacterium]
MNFRVSGLPLAPFQPLFALSDAQLAERHIIRQVADRPGAFPCRVSLRDAEVGERLLLLSYEHLPVATPFRSRHAIFVRESATEAHPDVNELPEMLARRLLSIRAFDDAGTMLDADVVPGNEAVPVIRRLLGEAKVAYLHAHNAKHGCFFARIDRS